MTQQISDRRLDALAAEYVLGTLETNTRVKLKRLMMSNGRAREAVWRWERDLNTLGASLNEVQPDEQLWQRIEATLGLDSPAADDLHQRRVSKQRTAGLTRTWVWPAIAASLVLVMVSWNLLNTPQAEALQVAVVQDAQSRALWSVNLTADNLVVTSTGRVEPSDSRDYELWLVAADGRAPVSLGLLPESGRQTLERTALFDSVDVSALAVSREPEGGSPTGQPTEVLYSAQLISL
jgi:anti-sigma-K factor RskA